MTDPTHVPGKFAARDAEITGAVRAEMGRQRVSATELGRRIGMHVRSCRRRLADDVPFSGAELEAIAAALGVSVTTFIRVDQAAAAATASS